MSKIVLPTTDNQTIFKFASECFTTSLIISQNYHE